MISMRTGELPTAYIITYISSVAVLLDRCGLDWVWRPGIYTGVGILGHRCTALFPLGHNRPFIGNYTGCEMPRAGFWENRDSSTGEKEKNRANGFCFYALIWVG